MDMISWLENWLLVDDTKVVYILSLILASDLMDFTIGFLNARLNKNVEFSSAKAILGITKKIATFILLALFIPFVLILPREIGLSALYILYLGYLISVFSSILTHLGFTNDTKDGDLFFDFLKQIMGGKK